MRSILVLLPMVAAVSQTGERIDGMQTTLRGIAEKAKKTGKVDVAVKTVIQKWIDIMNTTLVTALIAETNSNQEILDASYDAIEKCFTDRTTSFDTTVVNASDVRDESRKALAKSKHCGEPCVTGRGNAFVQHSLPTGHDYDYNISHHWSKPDVPLSWVRDDASHVDALAKSTCDDTAECKGECDCHEKMKKKCDELDKMVREFNGETDAEPDFCSEAKTAKPGAHPHTTDVDAREYYPWEGSDEADDGVYLWFSKMDTFVTENVANYKKCREKCHLLRYVHQHRTYETATLQREFERDFCAWAHSIDVTCDTYADCYNTTTKTWSKHKKMIEEEEKQFKLQQQALECALCYGEQLLADSTDLSKCDGVTECVNCAPLVIEYKTPHTEKDCKEAAQYRPCDKNFTDNEYSCFADHCPASDCTPCTDMEEGVHY